jgi:AcrR family transcriptional regulator
MSTSIKERVEAAALELLGERGMTGVTMSAVAEKADVSRQTLYNNYSGVEAILFAAVVAHQQQSFRHLAEILGAIVSPPARLEHLVRHAAGLASHGHSAVRGGFSAETEQLMAEHDRAVRRLIEEALSDGQESGEFRANLAIETDALLVQRMIEAAGELVAADPGSMARIVDAAVTSVLAAVRD